MGLNIDNKKYVIFDDSHQRRVNTSLTDNPSWSDVEGIKVRFVFRRNKTGDPDRDGNPLMYAMKGIRGYRISDSCREKFLQRSKIIIESMANDLDMDFIMPVPSSYSFCSDFASYVSGCLQVPYLSSSFIVKKTIHQILSEDLFMPEEIHNKRTRTLYASQLSAWRKMDRDQHVSMKEIDPKIRKFFEPLSISKNHPELAGAKILIVDDLMSTGTSIKSASIIVEKIGAISVGGLCFLSGL